MIITVAADGTITGLAQTRAAILASPTACARWGHLFDYAAKTQPLEGAALPAPQPRTQPTKRKFQPCPDPYPKPANCPAN